MQVVEILRQVFEEAIVVVAAVEAKQFGAGLAVPGWYVERRGRTEVWVMSGKEVSGLIRGRSVLNEALIERVVHQLDQRRRDVEF